MVDYGHSQCSSALARAGQFRVVVLGDPVLDGFLTGAPTELCRERPVPVLLKVAEENRPGGGANAAANLRRLGVRALLVGVVGSDPAAESLRRSLEEAGLETDWLVVDPAQPTAHKLRILAGDQYVARVDTERSVPPSAQVELRLLDRLQAALEEADAAIVSDYGLGSVSRPAMRLIGKAANGGLPVVLDAKNLLRHADAPVSLAKPNWREAHAAAGLAVPDGRPDSAQLASLGAQLRGRLEAETIAITMSADGVLLVGRDGSLERLPATPVVSPNELGAGDSLVAGAALGLAARLPLRDAVRLGMEAAAVAVAKPLTSTVSAAELRERLQVSASEGRPAARMLQAGLSRKLAEARSSGQRIVFTNGVFDLLHEGHVSLLRRARSLGDLLVVGINSDASARSLKGDGRPINDAEQRAAVLLALDCVDHVVVFEDLTASATLAAVHPAVYVKGDPDLESLPEAAVARELGVRLISIPRAREITTSQIIDRVLSAARTAAAKA